MYTGMQYGADLQVLWSVGISADSTGRKETSIIMFNCMQMNKDWYADHKCKQTCSASIKCLHANYMHWGWLDTACLVATWSGKS